MNRSCCRDLAPRTRRSGFTLIELLVVIGIIVLLIGLLLPALASVRTSSRMTATETLIKNLGDAADAFQLANNRYPGYLSERTLCSNNYYEQFSGTENALLDLMGGTEAFGDDRFVLADTDIYRDSIGRGPLINGQRQAPYFIPNPKDLSYANGQLGQESISSDADVNDKAAFPDLIDAWGTPVIFWRGTGQKSTLQNGQLVSFEALQGESAAFYYGSFHSYAFSDALTIGGIGSTGSVNERDLGWGNQGFSGADALFQAVVEHPTLEGTPRSGYIIMSAGADKVYFEQEAFGGNPPGTFTADDIEQFNDIIRYGGTS